MTSRQRSGSPNRASARSRSKINARSVSTPAGVNSYDAHATIHARATKRAGQCGESRVPARAGSVVEVDFLGGHADDADDDAAALRGHAPIIFAGHVDVAEHFRLPGRAPAGLVDIDKAAGHDAAGVVDENIDIREGRGDILRCAGFAEIRRQGVDLDGVSGGQSRLGLGESFRSPGH